MVPASSWTTEQASTVSPSDLTSGSENSYISGYKYRLFKVKVVFPSPPETVWLHSSVLMVSPAVVPEHISQPQDGEQPKLFEIVHRDF